MSFLSRPRILRAHESTRALVRATRLHAENFIVPLFVAEGIGVREEISAMPDYFRYSLDTLKGEIKELYAMGFRAVLLFVKVPKDKKDNEGREALRADGLMQRAIKTIKETCPEMLVMTDVALDPYSSFGHDGIVRDGIIVNDDSVRVLAQMSVSHAQAGADFVAPSDMMDGRVRAIREALEVANFTRVGIVSYAAKYASALYGPFRTALDSAPGFGDKKTYQMDPAGSAAEALKEARMDAEEGADMLLVKPAGMYLDIIQKIKEHNMLPIVAYQVSGEYAMIKAAAKAGLIDEKEGLYESLISIKRAGADMIMSYFAKNFVRGYC